MITKIKLLLLNVNRTGWHSGNMIYDMEAVKTACDTKVYGPGWPNYCHTDMNEIIKQLYGDDKPDVIYSYFTPNERVGNVYIEHYKIPQELWHFPQNLEKVEGVKKIFALSDFWARKPMQFSKDLKDSPFEYCVCCFTPPFSDPDTFYSFFDESIRKRIKFLALPRCLSAECFKDYGLPKQYDVISLGAMWHFYPLRGYMHNHLSANAAKLGINYHNYPYCGVNFNHTDFVREKYAQAINASKMLISCGGRYHLAYNKIFEAMGCATVYVGEKPYGEKELHMEDGVNYVAVTAQNFVDKIKYYLDHPSEYESIRQNGREMFLKYHTIEKRAEDFANLMVGL